jgi:hypothetical protein
MKYKSALAISVVLLSGMAMAQSVEVEPRPGIIGADSPLYGIDVAYDNLLKEDGDVAYERASEYAVAQEKNQIRAMERAEEQLNNTVAKVASSNNSEALGKAESVLEQVRESTPNLSSSGLDNAIQKVRNAKNKACMPPEEDSELSEEEMEAKACLPESGSGSGKPNDVGKP